jgi:hypothetical protein
LAVPVAAQSTTIAIEVDDIVRGDPGEVIHLETVTVPEGMVGWTCTGTAQTEKNASEHRNNDFILASGGASATIPDWERKAEASTSMSGTLVLGDSITVDLLLGPDGVSSGGVLITLSCAPPAPIGIDLVVTMDDAPRLEPATEPIVTPGDPFDYVVNVKNLGPEGADNVEAVLVVSEEVVADVGALDRACVPAGPDQIVCSIGAVTVGEIIKVRVAVRVREDSPGIGTFVSSVVVGDEDFPGERNEPNNRDEEPTTFPVPEVAGLGLGGRTDVPPSTGSNVRDFMLAALVTLGSGVLILTLNYEQRPLRPIPAARWAASLAREPTPIRSFAPTIDAAPSRHEPPMSMGAVFSRLPFELERLEGVAQRIRIVLERRMRNG